MKISQVEMFIHTSQSGSIAEAARKLNKSRTTVSAALSALEDDLGVQLLTRSGNKVILTEIGEAIANDCERLLQISKDIQDKCHQHLNGVETSLRIARDDALPEVLWRQLIQAMSERFPNTSISIYVAPPPELEQMVQENIVDVAYTLLADDHRISQLSQNKLGQIRMMSVAHQDHPLGRLRQVKRSDMDRYTEVALAYIDDESLKAFTPRASNFIALPFFEHMRDAVLDNTGWAYVPALLINEYLREGTLKVLKYNQAMSWQSYGEIMKSDSRPGSVIQWLSDQLADYLLEANH
ncbi:LysR family transcriptional regulator [Photobacterium sp. MCCC 1A19761]|uniref:LysR family transcriptional regulator n=1 Tax=Photobacterium sp. MCCC 1A19761 TaxID=3115000 RepID=UPI00307DFF5E